MRCFLICSRASFRSLRDLDRRALLGAKSIIGLSSTSAKMRLGPQHCSFLFLHLLRSSSAFACSKEAGSRSLKSDDSNIAALASRSSLQAHGQVTLPEQTQPPNGVETLTSDEALDGHISLRMARRDDVPHIQRCNLATLPENYNTDFYCNHMRQWPYLALVAEHVPAAVAQISSEERKKETRSGSGGIARFFGSGYDASSSREPQCQIVGYVLGKVDERQSPARIFIACDQQKPQQRGEEIHPIGNSRQGHVTSLAVLQPFRRRGLAQQLMNQLHHHMSEHYGADSIGLRVRVTNHAAIRLYESGLGYEAKDVIRGYYQDGEDAFLMQKRLVRTCYTQLDDTLREPDNESNGTSNWFGSLRSLTFGNKALNHVQSNSAMKLPRILWRYNDGMDDGSWQDNIAEDLHHGEDQRTADHFAKRSVELVRSF